MRMWLHAAALAFLCSICPHRSHFPNSAPHIFALAWSRRDWGSEPVPVLSGSRSVLALFVSVFRVQSCTLTLFSQRIRHAERWGPLHTKPLRMRKEILGSVTQSETTKRDTWSYLRRLFKSVLSLYHDDNNADSSQKASSSFWGDQF